MLISILASPIAANAAETNTGQSNRGRVIYNLDSTEFFVDTFGPVVPESIDKFVNSHAAAGITDLFVNVNAQRTNYQSDVWESCWDGYDPARGNNSRFSQGLTHIECSRRIFSNACTGFTGRDVTTPNGCSRQHVRTGSGRGSRCE